MTTDYVAYHQHLEQRLAQLGRELPGRLETLDHSLEDGPCLLSLGRAESTSPAGPLRIAVLRPGYEALRRDDPFPLRFQEVPIVESPGVDGGDSERGSDIVARSETHSRP